MNSFVKALNWVKFLYQIHLSTAVSGVAALIEMPHV